MRALGVEHEAHQRSLREYWNQLVGEVANEHVNKSKEASSLALIEDHKGTLQIW